MSVKHWCTKCDTLSSKCCAPLEHKEYTQWKSDFRLGGRFGQRIRQVFDKKEYAEAFESRTRTEFNDGKYIPVKSQAKVLFEDLAERYYKEHCMLYNRNAQETTLYRIRLIKQKLGKTFAEHITRKDIKDLRTSLLASGQSAASVNRVIQGVVGAIFSWAVEEELITNNPCKGLSRLPIAEPAIRFLSREEIDHLFTFFKSQRLKDFANLLYHTGARPSSIKDCSWDNGDIDLESKRIFFTTYKGRRNSVKAYRYAVPMDSVVEEIVLRRAEATGRKGRVFDVVNGDREARQAIKASKINENKTTPFTIYGLKHCFASHLLMNGASLFSVAKLLGHTDSKMVEKHYGHLTQEHLRLEQAKLTKPQFTIVSPVAKTA